MVANIFAQEEVISDDWAQTIEEVYSHVLDLRQWD